MVAYCKLEDNCFIIYYYLVTVCFLPKFVTSLTLVSLAIERC